MKLNKATINKLHIDAQSQIIKSRLKGAIDLPTHTLYPPGIYFLYKENELVYVGKSVNPVCRITQHKNKSNADGFAFDAAKLIPAREKDLTRLELAFIRVLTPRLNATRYDPASAVDLALINEFIQQEQL